MTVTWSPAFAVVSLSELMTGPDGAVVEVPTENRCSFDAPLPLGRVTLVSVLPALTGNAV